MASAFGGFMAGSIVAKLQMDKTGWNQSVQGVGRDMKTLKGGVGQLGSAFMGMAKIVAVAGVAVGGSLLMMTKKVAKTGDEIAKLSKKVGISAEALSGYRHAAELSGSSIAGFATGMRRLSSNMVDAEMGLLESKRAFSALGISIKDSSGKMKELDPMLLEVADKFAQMEDGTIKAAVAQDLFGRSGMDMIPMLNEGSAGLKKHREEAEKLGIVFSDKAAKACEEFNDTLTRLQGSLRGSGQAIGIVLMPALTEVFKGLTTFMVEVKDVVVKNADAIAKGVLGAFKIIIEGVKWMVAGLQILMAAWNDLNEGINKVVLLIYKRQLIMYDLLGKIIPAFREEAIKLAKTMAQLAIDTEKYGKASDAATDRAADLINIFDLLLGSLDNAGDGFEDLNKKLKGFVPNLDDVKETAKKGMGDIIFGLDLWGKAILTVEDIYAALSDKLESHVFKPIKKQTFDMAEFWKNVNQQIEASWIRGISKMITEFKDFMGAVKQLLNTLFQIFADTIAKIVIEWIKGTVTLKAAIASLGAVAWAALGLIWVKGMPLVLEAFQGVDKSIEQVNDRLAEAKRRGEEFIYTLSKMQLSLDKALASLGKLFYPETGTRVKIEPPVAPVLPDIPSLLSKLSSAFATLLATTNIPRKLERISRLMSHSFNLMIAQGYSFYDALNALKEPLGMIRDRFLEMGKRIPPALRPIIAMFEKMEAKPKLFEQMSGILDILKAFTETGFMTQIILKDLVQSSASLVRNILGISGNLKKALMNMGDLTKEQIMMLAPMIAPFLEAAQKFGLRLPDWVKDLAKKMGLEIEDQAIDLVPPLLDRIRRRLGTETTRVVKALHDVTRAIKGLPSGQGGLDFYSGSSGGLVRYHAMERVSIQPSQPNITVMPSQVSAAPVYLQLDGRTIARSVAKFVPELSSGGHWKMHKRGLVS